MEDSKHKEEEVLTEYELQREAIMARNKAKLAELEVSNRCAQPTSQDRLEHGPHKTSMMLYDGNAMIWPPCQATTGCFTLKLVSAILSVSVRSCRPAAASARGQDGHSSCRGERGCKGA